MDRAEELKERFRTERPAFLLGIELREIGNGRTVMRLPLSDNVLLIQNSAGVIFGGTIFWLADLTAAYAAMNEIDNNEEPLTIKAEAQFKRAGLCKEKEFLAESKIYRRTKTKILGSAHKKFFIKTEVRNSRGAIKASLRFSYVIITKEEAEKIKKQVE